MQGQHASPFVLSFSKRRTSSTRVVRKNSSSTSTVRTDQPKVITLYARQRPVSIQRSSGLSGVIHTMPVTT